MNNSFKVLYDSGIVVKQVRAINRMTRIATTVNQRLRTSHLREGNVFAMVVRASYEYRNHHDYHVVRVGILRRSTKSKVFTPIAIMSKILTSTVQLMGEIINGNAE